MTLSDLRDFVNLSYYPVPHTNWSNASQVICQYDVQGEIHKFDCDSRNFEECILEETCWAKDGGCNQSTQLAVAKFLECYEGPYANTESDANASMRLPCLDKVGLPVAAIQKCYENKTLVADLGARMLAQKTSMKEKVGETGDTPFPFIFLDGALQYNLSWVALTRLLCEKIESADSMVPDTCGAKSFEISFATSSKLKKALQVAPECIVTTALSATIDEAISNLSLPYNFDKADPPGYVNVKALLNLSGYSFTQTGVRVANVSVLNAFEHQMFGVKAYFAAIFVGHLRTSGISAASSESITNIEISALEPKVMST